MPARRLGAQERAAARRVFVNHYAEFGDCGEAARAAGVSERTGRRWRGELATKESVHSSGWTALEEPTRLVGRDDLLRAIASELEAHRLLTLVGPPGVGKTRVALRAFRALRDASEPGVFVDLRTLKTEADLCIAVGHALEMRLTEHGSVEERIEVIGRALRARGRVVAILDNFEQLPQSASTVLEHWLEHAPQVRFLVTSRRFVQARGEFPVDVPPLGLPEHEQDLACDAVTLFADRARVVEPRFRLDASRPEDVVALVRRVDGLPLALELAAAQMRRLTPAQLLSRLPAGALDLRRGVQTTDPRHQTLRTAIESSWSLLTPWERAALRQLTVFAERFTLEAAEAVLRFEGDVAAPCVADVLESLRVSSLLRPGDDSPAGELRWTPYEAVREFASELGDTGDESGTADRHARFYLDWGEARVAELSTARGAQARAALGDELENLRRALGHLLKSSSASPEPLGRLALVIYHAVRTWVPSVAVEVLTHAISRLESHEVDPVLLAQLYLARGVSHRECADYPATEVDLTIAESLVPSKGDHAALRAEVDYGWGRLWVEVGHHQRALKRLSRALENAETSGAVRLEGWIRCSLAWTLAVSGDVGAFEHYAKATALFAAQKAPWAVAHVRTFWCCHRIFYQRGDPRKELHAQLQVLRSFRDQWMEVIALNGLGQYHQERGEFARALYHYEEARGLAVRHGLRPQECAANAFIGLAWQESGQKDRALLAYERAIRTASFIGNRRSEGLNRVLLAGLLAQQGDSPTGLAVLDQAKQMLREIGDSTSLEIADLQEINISYIAASEVDRPNSFETKKSSFEAANGLLRMETVARVAGVPLLERSPEARAITRMIERSRDEPVSTNSTLAVWDDGSAFRWGESDPVKLPDGPVIRQVLRVLVEQRLKVPGEPLSVPFVLRTCWPGERVLPDAGVWRVRQVVKRLRRSGLRHALRTKGSGYLLDPRVPLRLVPSATVTTGGLSPGITGCPQTALEQ